MKKILVIIMLASLFACSKDEKSNEKTGQEIEQETFNALIGKWQFSRASGDKDFTNLRDPELTEDDKGNYIEFFADSTFVCKYYDRDFTPPRITTNEGPFRIRIFDKMPSIDMSASMSGLVTRIKDGYLYRSSVDYLTYTQNTFSFKDRAMGDRPDYYIEYKRVQ